MSKSMLSPFERKSVWNRYISVLAWDAPSPAPPVLRKTSTAIQKGQLLGVYAGFPEYSTPCPVGKLLTHAQYARAWSSHRNRYTLLAFASADRGRLNHRLLPASQAGLTSDQTRSHPRPAFEALLGPPSPWRPLPDAPFSCLLSMLAAHSVRAAAPRRHQPSAKSRAAVAADQTTAQPDTV